MCNCKNFGYSPVLQKLLKQGFFTCFDFVGNELVNQLDQSIHSILSLKSTPHPCIAGQIIIYVFVTLNHVSGHAILPFEQEEILY